MLFADVIAKQSQALHDTIGLAPLPRRRSLGSRAAGVDVCKALDPAPAVQELTEGAQ